MPISITCECGRQLMAKDEYAGRRTQCPDCGRELVIPGPGAPTLTGPGGVGDFEPGAAKTGPPPGYQEPTKTSGKAIASLVLGICSFFCCFTSIPGLIYGVLGLKEVNKSGGRISGQGLAIAGLVISGLSLLFALILIPIYIAIMIPAVTSARGAAQRVQCVNNERQIALAMLNFESALTAYPAQAIVDENGKPLLSWRVAILPYIEQINLYQQFHLDEPWDSPHNLSLLPLMPNVYQCPNDPPNANGQTRYQVFTGPGTLFDPAVMKRSGSGVTTGVKLRDVTDGTANTILVIEAANPVEWTKPSDLDFQPQGPLPMVGSNHPGGQNAATADGAVRFLKSTIAPETMKALITRNGSEVVPPDAF